MKKLYLTAGKTIVMFFLAMTVMTSSKAQLTQGDIAFTGYSSGGAGVDSFSFVVLVNITSGTMISFTDNCWTGTAFMTAEQTAVWTAPALVAGREVIISGPSGGTPTVRISGSSLAAGSISGTMPSLATSGDQVIAYQGAVATPTFISGIHMNVRALDVFDCANTTAVAWDPACAGTGLAACIKPSTLSTGTNAVWIGTEGVGASERNNAVFNCTGPIATAAQVRAAVNNSANWRTSLNAPTAQFNPSGCAFLASIFPVDLVNFAGSSNTNTIGLNWQTANEANDNGRYEIEKSADGVNFSKIGGVNAQGFSYLYNNYTFTDNAPLNGANFYRLKIINGNGQVKYSFVVKVLFGKGGRGILISPNPVVSEFTLTTAGSDYSQVVIADRNGRTVLQQKLSGNNNRIDVSKLPAGQYSVTVFGASEKATEKLLIVH